MFDGTQMTVRHRVPLSAISNVRSDVGTGKGSCIANIAARALDVTVLGVSVKTLGRIYIIIVHRPQMRMLDASPLCTAF